MIHWLDYLFSNFRWYRRLCGGHWEQWFIDFPVCSTMWIYQRHGERPGLGRGTPICEDWSPRRTKAPRRTTRR